MEKFAGIVYSRRLILSNNLYLQFVKQENPGIVTRKNEKWWKMLAAIIVFVLLVKTFGVTSCFIPSSGMENSLYKGEGVLINKWAYGLRIPFPSLFGYHRIGKGVIERGDIVLFNNPDPIQQNTSLENRDLFISRCVGLPGDTLMLNCELMNSGMQSFSPDSKSLYAYPSEKEDLMLRLLKNVGLDDNMLVGYTKNGNYIRSFSHYEYYIISQKAENQIKLTLLDKEQKGTTYPFIIPRKNKSVPVYPWNIVLLCNTITFHEQKHAEIRNHTLWVEGKPVDSYTFHKNYYWVASNDPVNLVDSRLFGFVPEDHIIGKVWRIWFTSQKERFFQCVQ